MRQGGIRQKSAEGMPKICTGCSLVPTHQFFPKMTSFFLRIFETHRFLFENSNFFLWNLETYPQCGKMGEGEFSPLQKFALTNFWTLKPLSIFEVYSVVFGGKLIYVNSSHQEYQFSCHPVVYTRKISQKRLKKINLELFGRYESLYLVGMKSFYLTKW